VQGIGLRVKGLRFGVQGARRRLRNYAVQGAGCRVK